MCSALLHKEMGEEKSSADPGTAQGCFSLSCQWPVVSKIAPSSSHGAVSPFPEAQGQANTQNPTDI